MFVFALTNNESVIRAINGNKISSIIEGLKSHKKKIEICTEVLSENLVMVYDQNETNPLNELATAFKFNANGSQSPVYGQALVIAVEDCVYWSITADNMWLEQYSKLLLQARKTMNDGKDETNEEENI